MGTEAVGWPASDPEEQDVSGVRPLVSVEVPAVKRQGGFHLSTAMSRHASACNHCLWWTNSGFEILRFCRVALVVCDFATSLDHVIQSSDHVDRMLAALDWGALVVTTCSWVAISGDCRREAASGSRRNAGVPALR